MSTPQKTTPKATRKITIAPTISPSKIKHADILVQYNEEILPQLIKQHFQALARKKGLCIRECIVMYKDFTLIYLRFNKILNLKTLRKLNLHVNNTLVEPCKVCLIPNKSAIPTIKEWFLHRLNPTSICEVISDRVE